MRGRYDDNFLVTLYNNFTSALQVADTGHQNKYNVVDPLCKVILMNNGCAFSEDCRQIAYELTEDYTIIFLFGALPNSANKGYDYINFNGMHTLIIFIDYFTPMMHKPVRDNPISQTAAELVGRFSYFEAIVKVVEMHLLFTTHPAILTNTMATTATGMNARYAPYIIAGRMLNNYYEITDGDIYGIGYDELMDLISEDKFIKSLYGIRVE